MHVICIDEDEDAIDDYSACEDRKKHDDYYAEDDILCQ
jgi:hypothetical protein